MDNDPAATARQLLDSGQAEEALDILNMLVLGPGDVSRDTELMQAEALADLGRTGEAVALFRSLLPDARTWLEAPQAALTYAMACQDQALADGVFEQVVLEQGALVDRGLDILTTLSQHLDAPVIWQCLSAAALGAGKVDLAWQANEKLLTAAPNDGALWHQAGLIRQQSGELPAAVSLYQKAVSLAPGQADSWNNLGNCLSDQCQMTAANIAFDNALSLAPENADFWCNKGKHEWANGNGQEAISAFSQALNHSGGQHAAARLGLACATLAMALDRSAPDTETPDTEAWQAFDARFQVTTPLPDMPVERWQGDALDNRHILLFAEEGFGDAIQFSRYIPVLANMAGKVSFCVPKGLVRLFAEQDWLAGVRVRALDDLPPDADCWLPLLSLPGLLGVMPDMPALATGAGFEPQWPPRRIGLVWQGNRGHNNDHHRSMKPEDLAPLYSLPGISAISLQFPAPAGLADGLVNGLAGIRDFADTARVLASLDLVVSVDTAIAHLAGGMGLPVALMVARGPDWRWGLTGARTSWYPSMRLFRQEIAGDWTMPVNSLMDVIKGGSFLADTA